MAGKHRVYWIDQAKAVGLLVVMLVHGPIPYWLQYYFRSFSMPRFFIIAGLFLHLNQPFWEYVKAKWSRLMVPYLFFSLVSYTTWFCFRKLTGHDANINPLRPFLWIFYGNGGGLMVHNRPLWFLPCLFTTLLAVYFMSRVPKPYQYAVMLVSAIVGYLLMGHLSPRPPWSLDLVLTTAVLTMLGTLFRDRLLKVNPLSWGALAIWSMVSIITAFMNVYVRLSAADVGNFFLFYLSAFAGTLVTMDLIRRVPYNRLLSYIGQHTLPIYALHVVIYMFLYEFFHRLPAQVQVGQMFFSLVPHSTLFALIRLSIFILLGLFIPMGLLKGYECLKALLNKSKPLEAFSVEPAMSALSEEYDSLTPVG